MADEDYHPPVYSGRTGGSRKPIKLGGRYSFINPLGTVAMYIVLTGMAVGAGLGIGGILIAESEQKQCERAVQEGRLKQAEEIKKDMKNTKAGANFGLTLFAGGAATGVIGATTSRWRRN